MQAVPRKLFVKIQSLKFMRNREYKKYISSIQSMELAKLRTLKSMQSRALVKIWTLKSIPGSHLSKFEL